MNISPSAESKGVSADSGARHAATATCTRQQTVLFVAALLITISALLMRLGPVRDPRSPDLEGIAAVLMWMAFARVGSNLRKLKRAERASPAG